VEAVGAVGAATRLKLLYVATAIRTGELPSMTAAQFLMQALSLQRRRCLAQTQKSGALSTVEAERIMAACQVAKDAVWLRAYLVGLGLTATAPTNILCDSQGAIALAKNPEHHQRSKHIDMRYHFVREQVAGGAITLVYTATSDMAADQLTKPLSRELHNRCMRSMGLQW